MRPDHALHCAVSSPGRHYYHWVFFYFVSASDGVFFSRWRDGSFHNGNIRDPDYSLHFVASDLGL